MQMRLQNLRHLRWFNFKAFAPSVEAGTLSAISLVIKLLELPHKTDVIRLVAPLKWYFWQIKYKPMDFCLGAQRRDWSALTFCLRLPRLGSVVACWCRFFLLSFSVSYLALFLSGRLLWQRVDMPLPRSLDCLPQILLHLIILSVFYSAMAHCLSYHCCFFLFFFYYSCCSFSFWLAAFLVPYIVLTRRR